MLKRTIFARFFLSTRHAKLSGLGILDTSVKNHIIVQERWALKQFKKTTMRLPGIAYIIRGHYYPWPIKSSIPCVH